jgi:hypothetical protein
MKVVIYVLLTVKTRIDIIRNIINNVNPLNDEVVNLCFVLLVAFSIEP